MTHQQHITVRESAPAVDAPGSVRLTEAIEGGVLDGMQTKAPNRVLVKLIDVGEGSSADYTAEALKLAETERIFAAGTHMYVDHAAALRRGPHGERSVRDLAAVLAEDAHYDDAMQALVAEVTLFGGHAEQILEVKDAIGVSISASAVVGPPRQGGSRPVVQRFTAVESVDFVVRAGRGGQILAVLESAALEAAAQDRREQLDRAVRDTHYDRSRDIWAGLRDFDDVSRLAWFYVSDSVWQQAYTVADDDLSVTLTGDRIEVRAATTYVPVHSGGATTTTTQEASMPEITEARLAELTESHTKVATLESERDTATRERDEAAAELATLKAEKALAEAHEQVTQRVNEACKGVAPQMAQRVRDLIVAGVTEAQIPADIDQRITSALEAEKAYLSTLTEGRITGFGASEAATTAQPARTQNAWGQPTKEA